MKQYTWKECVFELVMNKKIKNKTLVLTTTNGTKALKMAEDHQSITASFINFEAILNYLTAQNKDVILLCSGWKGLFNLEDSIFGGGLQM